jgi:sugar porter (SP) family MFS transporter
MFTGAVVIIVGAILTSTTNTFEQLIVGRLVLGAGIMFMTVAAPAYAIEIAPPHWRGRAVGFYNCGWFGGSIPAAFITYGCQFIGSDYSWRIPLILQCFTCLLVLSSLYFMPESPRWLMSKGQDEKAIEILAKYHGVGSRDSRLVVLEVEEIRENLREDAINASNVYDWRPLFRTKNTRWRSAQAMMMGLFGQFSGNGLGYYNAAIFDILGIKSSAQQLGYNIVGSVVSCTGALVAVSLTDRMNRRPVLIYGTFVAACMLALNGGLQTALANDANANGGNITNMSLAQGALAFYFLFNVAYSFAYTPLQGVLPAEALDTRLRAKGLALYGLVVNIFGFINLYATPIALQNIGYNYIWIFVGWDLIETALWYFFWYVRLLISLSFGHLMLTRPAFPASSLRVALSRSWSGSTTSLTRSRPPSMSTRLSSRPMAPSPRRSCLKLRTGSRLHSLHAVCRFNVSRAVLCTSEVQLRDSDTWSGALRLNSWSQSPHASPSRM